ncbi:hypothetical protein [Deinococcus wulumuqiensis]|nr:hypothetical protein [Deinococcus wulumuqiensis]QII22462.1 hypothetical protein G6R31_16530 [Deinococcus wulumuqiensis R12]
MTFNAFCRNCNMDEVPEPGQYCDECQAQADERYAEYLREQAEYEKEARRTDDPTSISF